jgi:hypothetical protein
MTVDRSPLGVRGPMSDVAKGEEGVPSEAGDIWLASAGKKSNAFGPALRASRGDPERRLTAWVPPCSRSLQRSPARIAPRFPRPSPAEGPRRSRQCRSGPAGAASASKPGFVGRARGAGPGPGGTWFAGGRGPPDSPTGGGGRAPIRPEENFATALYFLMEWCVKSPRTDGVADDRTRWRRRRWGGCSAASGPARRERRGARGRGCWCDARQRCRPRPLR